jgi:hypothetical protein
MPMTSLLYKTTNFEDMRRGVVCRECERDYKINKKKLNITMMQYLKKLYAARTKDGLYILASRMTIRAKRGKVAVVDSQVVSTVPLSTGEKEGIRSGDYIILSSIWGLVDVKPKQEGEGRAGYVRISQRGIDFVEGRIKVPGAAFIENYRNGLIGYDQEVGEVTFEQACATPFKPEDL